MTPMDKSIGVKVTCECGRVFRTKKQATKCHKCRNICQGD